MKRVKPPSRCTTATQTSKLRSVPAAMIVENIPQNPSVNSSESTRAVFLISLSFSPLRSLMFLLKKYFTVGTHRTRLSVQ